jgi:peptidoglycan/LPS O-acetylase OafA/YrhL
MHPTQTIPMKTIPINLNKRLFLLNGLAILGVIISHAAGWGQVAMWSWAAQYPPLSTVGYNLVYYYFLIVRQASSFCVVAFLFVSGFFVAYADRGSQSSFTWKMVGVRIKNLLIPYVIWSTVIYISVIVIDRVTFPPLQILINFFTTGVDGPYYFVPLLCYLYLLSPFMIPWAKKKPRLFLYTCAVIQFIPMTISYIGVFKAYFPQLQFLYHNYIPDWFLAKWIFFFALGLACGLHLVEFKLWLQEAKPWLPACVIVTGILALIEPEVVFRTTGIEWRFVPLMLSTTLYSIFFVLLFLAYDIEQPSISKRLVQWGGKSYGIYLLHMQSMQFFARLIYHFAPLILGIQIIFQPIMIFAGLAVPLAFIWFVIHSPARGAYRYLFG